MPKPKINDLIKFQEFAQKNGDKTQEEMTALWSKPVSHTTIGKALTAIGFTRKKKLMAIKKEMKKKGKNLFKKYC
ncbi:MAG TPA: hypothetical protein V6C58_11010 [Allocoleopsis sp.]